MEQDTKRIYKEIDQIYKSGKNTVEMEQELLHVIRNGMELNSSDPRILAGLLNELGGFYRTTANYELSKEFFLKAKALLIETIGLNHPDTATTINNLAGVYRLSGEYEKALELFREAKEIYERLEKTQDFFYGSILNNMGLVLMELRNYKEAALLFERSIALIQMDKGPVVYATGLGNLANAYDKLGRTTESEEMHLKAVSIFRSSGKEESLHFPSALNSLGQLYLKKKDYKKAEEYLSESLSRLERLYGTNHPEYKIVRQSLDELKSDLNQESSSIKSYISAGSIHPSSSYIKGMDRSFQSFLVFSANVLCTQFSEYMDRITIGLVGEGSDCFGYDDPFSLDHDALPEFNIWLSPPDYQKIGALLQEAYEKHLQSYVQDLDIKVKRGVSDINTFLCTYLPWSRIPRTIAEWETLRESDLFVLTRGRIFYDPLNRLTTIRSKLQKYYPTDLQRRKIAEACGVMAQTGQYNYPRVMARKDFITGNLILSRFLEASITVIYLLNKQYKPFYKWALRGLSDLPILGKTATSLISEISMEKEPEQVIYKTEQLCALISEELRRQKLSVSTDSFLIEQAKSVILGITDLALRNEPIHLKS